MTPPSPVREITFTAILLGLLLSVVMGAANVYLGLKAGMTVSASIPAAVLAMGLFRLLPRRGSILESNLVQTAASAGESLAAGIIFTMPALVIAGYWKSFAGWEPFLVITLIALAGGLLGILFMIPMRRVFIIESPELPYPEGIACAEVLQAGETAGAGVRLVLLGVGTGAVVKLLTGLVQVAASATSVAARIGRSVFSIGTEVSAALFAVGFIVELPIATLIFLGGAIGWLVAIPIVTGLGDFGEGSAAEIAGEVWSTQVRYMGVGAMVLGGVVTIFQVRSGLRGAIREIAAQFRPRGGGPEDAGESALPARERSIGGAAIIGTSAVAVAIIGGLYYYLTGGNLPISTITLLAMVVLSFFFTAVASYIVGLVGNSNSPVSGMTITAVLATAALIALFQYTGPAAVLATLGVAGVVCCAACTSGDVCNDLKTGQIVGATPRNQQVLQIAGVAIASFVMWPVLYVLHESNIEEGGIGGKALPAPQAGLFAGLTEGFFGEGEIPQDMLLIGVGIGAALLVLDRILARLLPPDRPFRLHLMPIAVGIYLPIEVSTPILLGGLTAFAAKRLAPARRGAAALRRGVLLASGLVAGEAITGVLASVWVFLAPERKTALIEDADLQQALGLLALCALGVLFLWVARAPSSEPPE